MTHDVRIMPEAYEALIANAAWWANHHSSAQALEWYESFIEALRSLSHMPESHSLARENVKTSYELRELHFSLGKHPTHRALFRISGKTVEVLTVRHVAQRDLAEDDLSEFGI